MANNRRSQNSDTATLATEQAASTGSKQEELIQKLLKQNQSLMERLEKVEKQSTPKVYSPTSPRKLEEIKDHCLVYVNTKADPDRFVSTASLSLPLEVPGPAKQDGSKPDKLTSHIALIPGIQAIPKDQRDQLFEPRFESVKPFISTNIIQAWADTWDLREMDDSKAISTISQVTKRSKTLVDVWRDYYFEYSEPVQRRLVQKLEELKMRSPLGGPIN